MAIRILIFEDRTLYLVGFEMQAIRLWMDDPADEVGAEPSRATLLQDGLLTMSL